MKMVHIKDLIYRYFTRDDDNNIVETIEAIAGVNMDVEQGQFIAILGITVPENHPLPST